MTRYFCECISFNYRTFGVHTHTREKRRNKHKRLANKTSDSIVSHHRDRTNPQKIQMARRNCMFQCFAFGVMHFWFALSSTRSIVELIAENVPRTRTCAVARTPWALYHKTRRREPCEWPAVARRKINILFFSLFAVVCSTHESQIGFVHAIHAFHSHRRAFIGTIGNGCPPNSPNCHCNFSFFDFSPPSCAFKTGIFMWCSVCACAESLRKISRSFRISIWAQCGHSRFLRRTPNASLVFFLFFFLLFALSRLCVWGPIHEICWVSASFGIRRNIRRRLTNKRCDTLSTISPETTQKNYLRQIAQ